MLLEIFISDNKRDPEFNMDRGYFSLFEECGNTKYRLFKPKNIFQYQPINGSYTTKIKVDSSK